MSDVEILSDDTEENIDSEVNSYHTKKNKQHLDKMLKLCKNKKGFPMKYIEDIDKMYKKCSDKEKNSTNLCNLILKGIKHIPVQKENSFQYVADVYNELLQLSKKDSTNLQVDNCAASTSRMAVDFDDGNDVHKTNQIFQELIDKCYENPNYPDSKIKVIDNLYKSLPPESVQSKYFVALLEEANTKIWPDSNTSLYVHLEWIQEQLNQFKTSLEAQNNTLSESTEANVKKCKKLKSLKVALKKVRKKIKDLEEAEMDVNNDNEFDGNSPYILADKYEKRALEIYKRMCKLKNEPNFLEAPPLRFKLTKDKLVNKTIEKYYNLNKTFPDYFEIFTLFELLNEKKNLNWNESKIKQISLDAFTKLGKQLKVLRLDEYFSRLTYFIPDKDPAEENPELKMKLIESNKKLQADLCAVRKKFVEKQKNVEESEGSNLENSDCEISSEDDSGNMNNISNKKTNSIPVKRKRSLSNESDDNNLPKKSKKPADVKGFDSTCCVVAIEKLDNVNIVTANGTDKVPDLPLKNTNANNFKQLTNGISRKGKKNENLENNNLIEEGCIINSNKDTVLTIDEDNTKNDLSANTFSIDKESNEPEVLILEGEIPSKDVIEIKELDDSDVEITESSNTSKVPVQNNKSLESMIKAMNFDKQFKWGQQSAQIPNASSTSNCTQTSGALYQHSNKPSINVSHLVNRWVMNNTLPHRPNIMHTRQPSHVNISGLYMTSQRMQSSFQNSASATQTARQVTQRFQQQRNLTKRVTTMTTTTTVRHIVQQQSSVPGRQRMDSARNSSQRSVPAKKNNSGKPDLIELD